MTTLLPFMVEYCFALPLTSRRLGTGSGPSPLAPPPGIRRTWLAMNSSERRIFWRAGAGVGLMVGEEEVGGGDEEDEVVDLDALGGEGAFEEGAQERVEG